MKKPCEINYAMWFCSAHQSGLTNKGKCEKRVRLDGAAKRKKKSRP